MLYPRVRPSWEDLLLARQGGYEFVQGRRAPGARSENLASMLPGWSIALDMDSTPTLFARRLGSHIRESTDGVDRRVINLKRLASDPSKFYYQGKLVIDLAAPDVHDDGPGETIPAIYPFAALEDLVPRAELPDLVAQRRGQFYHAMPRVAYYSQSERPWQVSEDVVAGVAADVPDRFREPKLTTPDRYQRVDSPTGEVTFYAVSEGGEWTPVGTYRKEHWPRWEEPAVGGSEMTHGEGEVRSIVGDYVLVTEGEPLPRVNKPVTFKPFAVDIDGRQHTIRIPVTASPETRANLVRSYVRDVVDGDMLLIDAMQRHYKRVRDGEFRQVKLD